VGTPDIKKPPVEEIAKETKLNEKQSEILSEFAEVINAYTDGSLLDYVASYDSAMVERIYAVIGSLGAGSKAKAANLLRQMLLREAANVLVNDNNLIIVDPNQYYINEFDNNLQRKIGSLDSNVKKDKNGISYPDDDPLKRKFYYDPNIPGDMTKAQDEVAIYFAKKWNTYSIEANKEVGAVIYSVVEYGTKTYKLFGFIPIPWVTEPDKSVIVSQYYSYSDPKFGSTGSVTLSSTVQGQHGNYYYTEAAQIHTHGAYSDGDLDGFSTDDIAIMMKNYPNQMIDTYVVTQWGNLYKADSLDGILGYGVDEIWIKGTGTVNKTWVQKQADSQISLSKILNKLPNYTHETDHTKDNVVMREYNYNDSNHIIANWRNGIVVDLNAPIP
jgi:hypothetical protein